MMLMPKMTYEKPTIQFWTASKLDAIRATMSGGGGGYSGGGGNSGGSGSGGSSGPIASDIAYVYGFLFDDDFDTRGLAADEQTYLANMGYTAYCNTNKNAAFAVGASPNTGLSRMDSGVFVFNGHANGGSCSFYVNSSTTYLCAEMSGNPYYAFGSISMSNCKAAFFFGCKTASYRENYGCLISKAVQRGADCAFGWNVSVLQTSLLSFCERIFYFLRYGYTVSDAAANAASEMPWFDGTRAYTIDGDGTTVLNMASIPSASPNVNGQTLDYNLAISIAETPGYRRVSRSGERLETCVKYVSGIPTLEALTIDRTLKSARLSGPDFSGFDERKARELLSMPSRQKVRDINCATIVERRGCRISELVDEREVFCKPFGDVALIRLVTFECVSPDGGVYLEAVCLDESTGKEVDYCTAMGIKR